MPGVPIAPRRSVRSGPRLTEQGSSCACTRSCRHTCLRMCPCANICACAHQPDLCPPTSETPTHYVMNPYGRLSLPIWKLPLQQREATALHSSLASCLSDAMHVRLWPHLGVKECPRGTHDLSHSAVCGSSTDSFSFHSPKLHPPADAWLSPRPRSSPRTVLTCFILYLLFIL